MTCIMDYPTAWAFIREQHPDPSEHHPRCSWVQSSGGVLCDCDVLNKEYARRKALLVSGNQPAMEPADSTRRSEAQDKHSQVASVERGEEQALSSVRESIYIAGQKAADRHDDPVAKTVACAHAGAVAALRLVVDQTWKSSQGIHFDAPGLIAHAILKELTDGNQTSTQSSGVHRGSEAQESNSHLENSSSTSETVEQAKAKVLALLEMGIHTREHQREVVDALIEAVQSSRQTPADAQKD